MVAAESVVVRMAVAVVEDEGSSSPESSPESGNRDEGYSTMSSDVQCEASVRLSEPPGSASLAWPELEDVKEEAEQLQLQVSEPGPGQVQEVTPVGPGRPRPQCRPGRQRLLLLDLQALGARHSFPPAKDLLQYQHVMRSFSDSHLCLRLLPHPHSFASTPASCPAAPPPVLLADLAEVTGKHPLRRARATASLLHSAVPSAVPLLGERELRDLREEDEDRLSGDTWSSDLVVDWWDSDYVQHWLRLDETRSALQQQHREALELEYDQAEMEDWSMSLSCEDLSWRRATMAPPPEPVTPAHPLLPIIQVGATHGSRGYTLRVKDSWLTLWVFPVTIPTLGTRCIDVVRMIYFTLTTV